MVDSPRRRRQSRSRSFSRSRSRGKSHSRSPSPIHRSQLRSRSRGRNDSRNPGNTLYVTGLSSKITERDLEDHFSREGKVVECNLIVEPQTRASRGFAFVTMDTVEDADRCIKYLNQSVLEGRYITVEKSRRRRPRTPTPGNYLGLKNPRDHRDQYNRGRNYGGYARDDYGDRNGRDYSPHQSSYGGRSRREHSRPLPRSPYRSPDRSYGRHSHVYAR